MNKVDILGVKIDDITVQEALKIVEGWLKKPGKSFDKVYTEQSRSAQDKHYIVTTNPEFIIASLHDPLLKKILNDADLSIPDGIGLKMTGKVKNRISGTDLMEKLVDESRDWVATVGFLGGRDGVAEKCAERLKKKYPGLKISFAEEGGEVDKEGFRLRSNNNIPSTDILFVALGHPKQEKWIANNLLKLDVKVAMGVGGAFNYISGKVSRAPKWLRDLGLEWLFRLIVQPWRIKRQLALFKFLWMTVLK